MPNPTNLFATMAGRPPEEAKFFWSGGPVEVAERTWFASLVSGLAAFETDDGIVLVDSGAAMLAPGLASLIRARSNAPIQTAIFTHGHADHAYGLSAFLAEGQDTPVVIGHEAMPARFDRYDATAAHNQAVNARQFGGTVGQGPAGHGRQGTGIAGARSRRPGDRRRRARRAHPHRDRGLPRCHRRTDPRRPRGRFTAPRRHRARRRAPGHRLAVAPARLRRGRVHRPQHHPLLRGLVLGSSQRAEARAAGRSGRGRGRARRRRARPGDRRRRSAAAYARAGRPYA